MNDPNFWKKLYQPLWEQSSKKEDFLKNLILAETGLELVPYGLGAGESVFISGSAKDNNNEKGAPDFQVKGKPVFIEVTGPLNQTTRPEDGIWIRPDKLNYAFLHKDEAEEFFVLYFPAAEEWVTLHTDQAFFDHVAQHKGKTDYKEIKRMIRGAQERYIEISYQNPFVKPLDDLISFLKQNCV